MNPLSSYGFPFHSPLQSIELPFCQSLTTLVPNIYCFIASGFISAFHALSISTSIEIEAFAEYFFFTDNPFLKITDSNSQNKKNFADSENCHLQYNGNLYIFRYLISLVIFSVLS